MFSYLYRPLLLATFCMAFAGQVAAEPSQKPLDPVDRWLADIPVGVTSTGKPVVWKFAHPAPPVSLLPPVWQAGFDWLEASTGGQLKMKMYGGGSLYGATGGFKAIRAGVADYGTCYTVAESRGFELLKTLQVPYIAPSNPYLTARIVNELTEKWFAGEFKRRGVYPAHIMPMRPLTLMSKSPIRSPEDLKGKKVVSFMNTPGAADTLGYSEVRLPFTEIYTALQQGVVDAIIWVDMGFVPFKIYEQAKYYTQIDVAPATIETCMNRRSFDRLSRPLKQALYDFQQKVGVSVVKNAETFSQTAQGILEKNGVEIIQLAAEDKKQWKAAFNPVVDQWMSACEKAGKDCRALVKDIERLKAKYKETSDTELMRLAIEDPVQGMIGNF